MISKQDHGTGAVGKTYCKLLPLLVHTQVTCDGHRARENHSEANPTAAKPSWKPQHVQTFCLGLKTVLVRKDHSKSQNWGMRRGRNNGAQQVPLCL